MDDAITLKKLEIFLTFMRTGTLAGAAEALDISSVSVHRAIHSLEEALKCPLFRQEGRLLVPLPSAETLAEQGLQVMQLMDDAIKATRADDAVVACTGVECAFDDVDAIGVPRARAGDAVVAC